MYRRPPVPPQPAAPMIRALDGSFVHQGLAPRHRPVATWALLVTLVVLYVVQSTVPGFIDRYALLPAAVRAGEWWRIFTSALLHAPFESFGLMHIGANVYFGWSIGPRMERHVGAWRMLAITFVAMLGSGVAVTAFSSAPAVGFSGVLYGWLASWLAFHLTPRFPGLRLSGLQRTAFLQLLGANLLISLLPGISLLAHAGGFLAGFAVAFALGRKR